MTRSQMLKQMGLTEHQFKHLMESFSKFYNGLDAAQKAVVRRSLPSLAQAAKTFGPDVQPGEMMDLFDSDNSGGTFNSEIAGNQPNPDPPPGG